MTDPGRLSREPLLTKDEAAAILRIPPKQLKDRYRLMGIPATKVGRCLRFELADIDAYLKSRRVEA